MIAIIVVICLVGILFSLMGRSGQQRETNERLAKIERSLAPKRPVPLVDYPDCSAEAIDALRAGNILGAIAIHARENKPAGGLKESKLRIEAVRTILLRGPELGRPPASVFDHLQGKVGPG